jgi:hypothetical protein
MPANSTVWNRQYNSILLKAGKYNNSRYYKRWLGERLAIEDNVR